MTSTRSWLYLENFYFYSTFTTLQSSVRIVLKNVNMLKNMYLKSIHTIAKEAMLLYSVQRVLHRSILVLIFVLQSKSWFCIILQCRSWFSIVGLGLKYQSFKILKLVLERVISVIKGVSIEIKRSWNDDVLQNSKMLIITLECQFWV